MPIRRTVAACVLSGLLVAAGLFLTAGQSLGQFPSSQDTARWWPPHPEDQVQIYSAGHVVPSGGGDLILYSVPTDRWLVIVPNGGEGAAPSARLGIDNFDSNTARLVEIRDGQRIEKGRSTKDGTSITEGPAAQANLGWTFAPGSTIVIECSAAMSGEVVKYNLFGYLAPVR